MKLRRTAPHRTLALAGLALLAAATAAAQSSPWYVGASQSIGHESNLLRLSTDQAVPAGFSKSDTVSATSLLAGIDQPIGRQRLFGNLALRATRYAENKTFDNQGYTLAGGVDWSTIERVSGSVRASANRTLASFNTTEIGLLTRKNMETTQTLEARVRVGLVTQYSFEAALDHRRVDNSLDEARVQSRDYRQTSGSLGLRWRPRAASDFGIALRSTEGEFPRFQPVGDVYRADRYSRRDVDLTAILRPNAISSYDIRLSYGSTEYDVATQRDFSGFTGNAGWIWRPTAKLRLDTRISRDTGQESYAVTIFGTPGSHDYSRVSTSLRLKLDYEATAKVALTGTLQYTDRDFVRTIDNPVIPLEASGRERWTVFSIGARWAPTRTSLVGCDAGVDARRGSGALGSDLRGNRFGCYGQITLQ